MCVPAVATCPGRSGACQAACYAATGRYLLPSVRTRLARNFRHSRRADFAPRMIAEVEREGALVVRVHCSGDFYSAAYAGKWLAVMRQCPRVRFYLYTRSWRVPTIAPVLAAMATLPSVRVWYSVDTETGLPPAVPPGVRRAHLRVSAGEADPAGADLVFVPRPLVAAARRVGLPLLCPHQAGRRANCGACGTCFR